MGTTPVFASASEALEVVRAGLRFLAAADAAAMGTAEQAGCLQGLEQVASVVTAARTSVLGAFGAGQGYADDGDYSACSWLVHRTQVTQGTAVAPQQGPAQPRATRPRRVTPGALVPVVPHRAQIGGAGTPQPRLRLPMLREPAREACSPSSVSIT